MVARWTLSAFILSCFVACSGRDADREQSSAHHAPIVRNDHAAWEGRTRWRISASPTLDIGSGTDSQPILGFVVSGARLSDGRVVVAERPAQLRVFGRDGKERLAIGRQGSGPGEFRMPVLWMRRVRGDTLVVYDGTLRLSVVGPAGSFVRVWERPGSHGGLCPWALDAVTTRRIVMRMGCDRPSAPAEGVFRNSLTYGVFDLQTGQMDTMGIFPGPERYAYEGGSWGEVTFGATTVVAAGGGVVYLGTGDAYPIWSYSEAGRPRLGIHRSTERQRVREVDRRPYLAQERLRAPGVRTGGEVAARVQFVEAFPAYTRLVVDALGYLWVEAGTPPEVERTWTVFGADGHMLGDVSVPATFDLFEVGADYVLGRWTDPGGAHSVRVYGLTRP